MNKAVPSIVGFLKMSCHVFAMVIIVTCVHVTYTGCTHGTHLMNISDGFSMCEVISYEHEIDEVHIKDLLSVVERKINLYAHL